MHTNVDDGLQAGEGGGASLAEAQQLGAVGEGRRGCQIHRRRHGESGITRDQRDAFKTFPYTTLAISPGTWAMIYLQFMIFFGDRLGK